MNSFGSLGFFTRIGQVLARYVVSLFAASVLIFVVLRLVPGDPAEVALGTTATPEAVAQLQHTLGTDKPLVEQYFSWIGGMLHGDFGTSYSSGQDIGPLLLDRTNVSLIIVLISMVLAFLIAIPFGTWAAVRNRRWDGTVISGLSQIGIAIPSFLAAIILVSIFAVHLDWVPANSWVPPQDDFGGFVSRLILPCFALALVQAAILTRYVRSSVLSVLHEDYIRTARATGLSPSQALIKHGLRNAFVPVIAVSGVQMASLVIGAVVIERVFVIPGLGSFLLDAVNARDMITVQSSVMMLVTITLTITLLADALTAIVDPRIQGAHRD